jgi:glyoxylase-like metal-dependent hydrolase (beta-lactamase superfamily II)
VRLSRACYAVTGLGYAPPWCVNAGFIVGDKVTLVVDTGGNALAAATIYGYATAVRNPNRLIVLNTEKHFDHIGGNSYFAQHSNIDIWGHPALKRTEAEFTAEIEEFNGLIPNRARRERREAEVFFGGTQLTLPTRKVQPGAAFELGGTVAEIHFTPGHTPTNISVWVPEDRVLFAGDCLVNGYLANLDAAGPGGWLTWLDSLEIIEALDPKFVVCGHGPVARDGDVSRIIQTVRRTLEAAIESGHSPTAAAADDATAAGPA